MQEALIEALNKALVQGELTTDEAQRRFFAQDVFTSDMPAGVVVSPASTAELANVVRAATQAGHAVVTRGGGMSYTSGYVPRESGTVMIDMSRMARVLEINQTDMYVTVEAGVSWKALFGALTGTGRRTT